MVGFCDFRDNLLDSKCVGHMYFTHSPFAAEPDLFRLVSLAASPLQSIDVPSAGVLRTDGQQSSYPFPLN